MKTYRRHLHDHGGRAAALEAGGGRVADDPQSLPAEARRYGGAGGGFSAAGMAWRLPLSSPANRSEEDSGYGWRCDHPR